MRKQMLTQKQEKFVQEMVKGKTQFAAYKAAYNAENMKDETIANKACNLFKQDKIRARYDQLMENVVKKTADTAESIRAWGISILKEIAEGKRPDVMRVVDCDGCLIRKTESISQKDVNNAIKQLFDLYGVTQVVEEKEITVRFVDNLEEYGS